MKHMHRILQILLALLLSFTMLPQKVHADEEQSGTYTWYNPLYYDGEQAELLGSGTAAASLDPEIVAVVRNYLRARVTSFTVVHPGSDASVVKTLINEAMEHTGQPTEGDYLKWQFQQWRASYGISGNGYRITYNVTYYTNAGQESQMDSAAAALLEELDLDGTSDYAKVRAVYNWMADNIKYASDYNTNPQNINHTAYGALIRRVCVCQGYAVLFYRLMLTLGIDCRLIAGTGNGGNHAWNIVKLGDLYYDLDVTWASTAHNKPEFFLRGTRYFYDHTPEEEYDSEEFHAAYPLSEEDYVPTAEDEKISVTDLILEPESLQMETGETAVLAAQVKPDKATDPAVTWISDDPSVADVSADGTVSAIAPGETVIHASAGNITKTCPVTVIRPQGDGIAYAAIDTENRQGIFFRSYDSLLSKEQEIDVEDIQGNVYHVRLLTSDVPGDRLEEGLANDASVFALFAGSQLPCESISAAPEQTVRLTQSMAGWFMDLKDLREFDAAGLDTSAVVDMRSLFAGDAKLEDADLSAFNTGSVLYFQEMFKDCIALKELDLSSFDTSSARTMTDMFAGCTALESVTLGEGFTVWNADACLPEGIWTDGTLYRTEKQLQEEYPSHAAEWLGTWNRLPAYEAVWTWEDDLSAASVSAVLDDGTVLVTVTAAVTVEETPAECEKDGSRTASAEAVLLGTVVTDKRTMVLPAFGHKWQEPSYVWSKSYGVCTGTAVCEHDHSHVLTETAEGVRTVIKEPGCETEGTVQYAASFKSPVFEKQTVQDTLSPLGHDWSEWQTVKEPTEEESGLEERTCSRCGAKEQREILPLDHVHDLTYLPAVQPLCETDGHIEYWKCEKCGRCYRDADAEEEIAEEETILPALGHSWQAPTYIWSKSYHTCTGNSVCARDSSHVLIETAESVRTVIREAGCESEGIVQYAAVFKSEIFTEQTVQDTISPLGHDWTDWVIIKESAPGVSGLKQRTCRRCGETETEEIPALDIIPVASVELNKDELTLRVGRSETLIAAVLPEDAQDTSVTWSSSDPAVAKVDANGKVTAVADTGIAEPSTAVITVTTNDGGYTASCTVTVEDPINAFVRRLYKLCFNRNADAGGFRKWTTELRTKKNTAAATVQFFFSSKEFENLQLNNEDFVEMCYAVLMGRKSDAGGKRGWVSRLEAGMSETYILRGFVGSSEFTKICNDYGVERGEITLSEPRDQNQGITEFVSRCYSEVLGRKADTGGLNNWCKKILNAADKKQEAINTASNGFFHSPEYLNKNTTNDQYVKTLYRTFLGREADTGGYNNWMAKLNSGTSRDSVMNGFAYSAEFANIMAKYGIR